MANLKNTTIGRKDSNEGETMKERQAPIDDQLSQLFTNLESLTSSVIVHGKVIDSILTPAPGDNSNEAQEALFGSYVAGELYRANLALEYLNRQLQSLTERVEL